MKNIFIKKINKLHLHGFFLCSNDIKINDTVIDQVNRIWENIDSSFLKAMVESNNANKYPKCYKIIGEISPAAINKGYIKDGMIIENLDDIYYMPVEERKYCGWNESIWPLIEVKNPEDGILY